MQKYWVGLHFCELKKPLHSGMYHEISTTKIVILTMVTYCTVKIIIVKLVASLLPVSHL